MEKEKLINLLATATYGSDWLEIKTLKKDASDADPLFETREDRWVHRLLEGKQIVCIDWYEDDEQPTRYYITLEDIKKGLIKARNGEAPEDYWDWFNETSSMDYDTCSNLMQVILHGEIIYG